jgi:glc operon protein GlcG
MRHLSLMTVAACAALTFGTVVHAQQPAATAPAAPPPGPPPAYGPPISLADAKKVAAAAEAESLNLGLHQVIAIVEPSGDLVYFERMEGSSYAHIQLAQRKAQTAARFRAPSMAFQDRVQANNFLLGLEGMIPVGGGVPIVSGGKIVGAIGVAGAPISPPDVQVANAGAAALK